MSSTTIVKEPVLPWMRVPVSIEAGQGVDVDNVNGLSIKIKESLKKDFGFNKFFPVQSVTWKETAGGSSGAHDICIAAPTGSGKTLAYALPVINELSRQNERNVGIHCLRALVVLPTRDLAAQVYQVFKPLCQSVSLNVVLVAARISAQEEADEIIGVHQLFGGADIVIATPGRLTSHLYKTKGFHLRHLKFLVVDETDRLLRQSYQEWLTQVIDQISQEQYGSTLMEIGNYNCDIVSLSSGRVIKYIVSATLTRDPSKLERLQLFCPRYIAASSSDHRYHLPKNLREHKIVCSGGKKPLLFLALLKHLQDVKESTVIFASSLEMAHKIHLLIQSTSELSEAVVFSSRSSVAERSASVHRFKTGAANFLVASDALTRGIDLEAVKNVINYDTPTHIKTYVHRAGRTARAGRSGRVFSLLRPNDVRHFRTMLRKADNNNVRDFSIPKALVERFKELVPEALYQVQELLAMEDSATDTENIKKKMEAASMRKTAMAKAAAVAKEKGTVTTGILVSSQIMEEPAATNT
mmetsp:Transcript_28021/g.51761  ORF Transcript_28021/g.51761 Transcript_28021/m.51761 type:complete len:525 (-) Transcript_28021:487-2061(-)